MNHLFLFFIYFTMFNVCTIAKYITPQRPDFGMVLNSWIEFKNKIFVDSDVTQYKGFSELEAVELIPLLIKLYKSKLITKKDETILLEIYGNLWPIIVEEADRQSNQEMNPFMKSLSKAFELAKYIQNEADVNSRPAFDVNVEDNLSQRILKTAAMLIHNSRKQIVEKTKVNKKATKTSVAFNLRIRNFQKKKKEERIRRNVGFITEDEESYYEDNEDSMGKGSRDYLYDESYEDDEDSFSISSSGSFQALFIKAAEKRFRKEHEENKLS